MSHHIAPLDTLRQATDAVVEYALLSLEPEFLCWEKDVNMQVAELVWNVGGLNLESTFFHAPGGDVRKLVDVLCHAKRSKWPNEDVLLLNLDVHHEDDEIVFTFELSWDEGENFQACRVAVDEGYGTPEQRN